MLSSKGRKRRILSSDDEGHDKCEEARLKVETSFCTSDHFYCANPAFSEDNRKKFRETLNDSLPSNLESSGHRFLKLDCDHRDPNRSTDPTGSARRRSFPSLSIDSQSLCGHQYSSEWKGRTEDHRELHHIRRRVHASDRDDEREKSPYLSSLEEYLIHILDIMTPTSAELNERRHVIESMLRTLKPLGLTAKVYGSLITGLMIRSSDIDMVMIPIVEANSQALLSQSEKVRSIINIVTTCTCENPTPMQKAKIISCIRIVGQALRYRSSSFNNVLTITRARVPIVKCETTEGFSLVKVDLTFDKSGLSTSSFLCKSFLKPGNEFARGLTTLVKVLLASAFLNDPSVGGLGSFPTAIMVLFFVENYVKKHVPQELRSNMAVLLVSFLKFFGEEFDFRKNGIDYIRGQTFLKPPTNALFLTNPLLPGTNCAAAATLFETKIRPYFWRAAEILCPLIDSSCKNMKLEGRLHTLFSAVTTPSYQRNRRASFLSFKGQHSGGYSDGPKPQKANIWDDDGLYCGTFLDLQDRCR